MTCIGRRSFFYATGSMWGCCHAWGCNQKSPAPTRTETKAPDPPAAQPVTELSDEQPSGKAEPGEVAILAGGCFWGMEEILREVPGVLDTQVGYAGGHTQSPSYEQVKAGNTGHAESVKVVFDPKKLSYARLLKDWFFRMHDPTTINQQGNDVGTQYRSAIFYASEQQKQIAERVLREVEAEERWADPIVTQLAPAGPFTPAEGYHQDYLQKNPGGYTCHYLRE